MLNGILWLAFVTAGVAGLTAVVMTQSLLWGFLAYSGAGMAVLMALLVTEMVFGEAPAEIATDDAAFATGPRS